MSLILPLEGYELYCDPDHQGPDNDDPVNSLTDYSGNSRHFISDGTAPVFKTNIVNDKTIVRFNERNLCAGMELKS